jgi:hypothetical protein
VPAETVRDYLRGISTKADQADRNIDCPLATMSCDSGARRRQTYGFELAGRRLFDSCVCTSGRISL